MTIDAAAITSARELLGAADHIVVLTGAGISTDSGIPDFRGPEGLWTKNPAAEKASDIRHWVSDPEVRRAAWRTRVEVATRPQPEPNAGHRAVAALEATGRVDLVVTQNVDGLHLTGGSDPARLVEIHGTTREIVCLECGDRNPTDVVLERVRSGEDDPVCNVCGGMLKSATISFGQNLVPADLERAEDAARSCDLLLAIGSTLSVFPIAAMVPVAVQGGARLVIVNGGPTEFDDLADVMLRGSISDILPRIVS